MVFPTFFNLSLNLAIRSSWSEPQSAPGLVFADCIASTSLAAKNIISLISVLTVWWCPCVKSSLVLLEEGVCYEQCLLWQNSISLCPASFCTPMPNLPVTPGVSWLPTFAFQSPIMKRTSFLDVSSRPFRYDLNQIPYNYTVEVTNRFKGLDLIECLKNYGLRFMTMYRRQWSRPSPRKRNAKRQNGRLRRPYK